MQEQPINEMEKRLEDKIFKLRKLKRDFEVVETTGTAELTYTNHKGEKKKNFFFLNNYENANTDIREICRRVKSDVKKYLETNPKPIYDFNSFCTLDYNRQRIKTIEPNNIIHEIDINSCYWTLAYRKGFISSQTYRDFILFKEERLIALGNLAKNKYIKTFKAGRLKFVNKIHSPHADFFFSIVCEVFSIYCEICGAISNNKPYYFKTDAFWVEPSIHIQNKIKAILEKHGLSYKVTRLKVKSIDGNKIECLNLNTGEDKTIKLIY